jgi:hypothetical protein
VEFVWEQSLDTAVLIHPSIGRWCAPPVAVLPIDSRTLKNEASSIHVNFTEGNRVQGGGEEWRRRGVRREGEREEEEEKDGGGVEAEKADAL